MALDMQSPESIDEIEALIAGEKEAYVLVSQAARAPAASLPLLLLFKRLSRRLDRPVSSVGHLLQSSRDSYWPRDAYWP